MHEILDKSQTAAAVFAAVDEVNRLLRRTQRLDHSLDTVVSGAGAQLDSLGLVNLISAIEQKVEQEFGVSVALADALIAGQDQNPVCTLGTVVDYLHGLVESKKNG
jgi:acyl carrier protein